MQNIQNTTDHSSSKCTPGKKYENLTEETFINALMYIQTFSATYLEHYKRNPYIPPIKKVLLKSLWRAGHRMVYRLIWETLKTGRVVEAHKSSRKKEVAIQSGDELLYVTIKEDSTDVYLTDKFIRFFEIFTIHEDRHDFIQSFRSISSVAEETIKIIILTKYIHFRSDDMSCIKYEDFKSVTSFLLEKCTPQYFILNQTPSWFYAYINRAISYLETYATISKNGRYYITYKPEKVKEDSKIFDYINLVSNKQYNKIEHDVVYFVHDRAKFILDNISLTIQTILLYNPSSIHAVVRYFRNNKINHMYGSLFDKITYIFDFIKDSYGPVSHLYPYDLSAPNAIEFILDNIIAQRRYTSLFEPTVVSVHNGISLYDENKLPPAIRDKWLELARNLELMRYLVNFYRFRAADHDYRFAFFNIDGDILYYNPMIERKNIKTATGMFDFSRYSSYKEIPKSLKEHRLIYKQYSVLSNIFRSITAS
jgi:hypothetical protein